MSGSSELTKELQRRFDRRDQDRDTVGYCYFDRHVQMRKGEVFLGNVCQKEFQTLALKTKRLGGVAFTFRGAQYPETRQLYSAFATLNELEELGVDCKLPEAAKKFSEAPQ